MFSAIVDLPAISQMYAAFGRTQPSIVKYRLAKKNNYWL